MNRDGVARLILAVDSAGCAAAAALLAGSQPLAGSIAVNGPGRGAVVAALGATSAVLGLAAAEEPPSDRSLGRAAAVNAGWVAVCLTALTRRPGAAGAALIATTAAADGIAAAIQWSLRGGDGAG